MPSFLFSFLPWLSVVLALLPFATCDSTNSTVSTNSTTESGAVFVFTNINSDYENATAGATQFVFALNLVPNGDLYFHMSAPFGNAWMGVGIGSSMPGALMFIAYPSANSSGITISPRIALHGQSEPSYTSAITCEKLYTPGLISPNNVTATSDDGLNGAMTADAVCHNVTSWSGYHTLDFTTTTQPFIFAVGPGEDMVSDSLSAPLRRHSFHGDFTLDMTHAASASASSVPLPNASNGTYISFAASAATDAVADNDLDPVAHAVLMCLAFIIVFPFGAILARAFNRMLFHAAVQTLGAIFVLVGFGLAVNISAQYNQTRAYRSAHQVIGLLLFCGVLVQFGLGLARHLVFKKTQRQPGWGRVHLVLGPVIMLLGVVNGGLGLNLAGSQYVAKPYIVVVVMVALVFFVCRGSMAFCSRSRRKDDAEQANNPSSAYQGIGDNYQYQQQQYQAYGMAPQQQQQQYPAQNPPPAYGQSYPLQPYHHATVAEDPRQQQQYVQQTVVYPKPAGWP